MKNANIYKSSNGGPIVILVAAIVMTLVSVLSYHQDRADNWIPWVYVFVLLGVAADTKFGIYAKRKSDYFCETKHFFYRRCIKISSIAKIMYKPTWMIGKNMRSLYLVDKERGAIGIRMANGAYPITTLRQVVKELANLNPAIELDADARKLLQIDV